MHESGENIMNEAPNSELNREPTGPRYFLLTFVTYYWTMAAKGQKD